MISNEFKIFGKEYIESHFENDKNRNIFISSLVNEFSDKNAEINAMTITNELLMVRIEFDNYIKSRLYRRDNTFVEINNEDATKTALNILMETNNLKMVNSVDIEDETYDEEDFEETYVKSLKDFIMPSKTLKMIQDYMYGGVNVLLKGGPGTGKTDFPQKLAAKLKMKNLIIDCGTIKTPQDWFGTREYIEGEGTKFIPSELVEYLQQPSIIVLDEINRTTPDCHNSIFRILDGNREVHILPLKKTINVHPRCIIMATMNEGRSHTGIYMLDSAVTDRFEIFRLQLPTQKQIVKILSNRFPSVKEEFLVSLAKLTHKLNSLYESENLNVQIGLRPSINACVLLQRDNKFIDVLNQAFTERFSNEGGIDSEQTIVKQTFSGIIDNSILLSNNSNLYENYNKYDAEIEIKSDDDDEDEEEDFYLD